MDLGLKGRVAIVTGSSQGIGKAIAVGLAKFGADVAVASRKLPDLEQVATEIKGLGRKSMAVATHVGRMEEINALVQKLKDEFGRIDILVNNAGGGLNTPHALEEIQEKDWNLVVDVNLKGAFFSCSCQATKK